MKSKRINKAIEIINYAVNNQISVKEASVKFGFADTYVKNVKAILFEKYEKGVVDYDLFNKFKEAYTVYENGSLNLSSNNKEKNDINADIKLSNKIKNSQGEKISYNEDVDTAIVEWKSGANYPADHIKTLDELLKVTKVDTKIWSVRDYIVNKWDVTSWKNNFPETIQNYQVKAHLEKNKTIVKEQILGELFKELIKNYKPPILNINPKSQSLKESNLLEIALFDLHLGKLAWGGETGENYDTKIARERFLNTISILLNRAQGFEISKILFPVGSDFFNSDTIYNTTTKGTPQDEDLRWQKTFKVGIRLIIDAINLMKQLGVPIDVIVIPGNHDFERSFYMGACLEAWFNNDLTVKVNNGASPRKYYKYGNVLLGFTHGSEEKENSLPLLMATDIESKPMWSETIYHEWHLGHIHRKRDMKYTVVLDKSRTTNEDLGVTIRYLSSLTGTEEWHHKKGFVGQIKAGEAFVWNNETGLVAHLNSNLNL